MISRRKASGLLGGFVATCAIGAALVEGRAQTDAEAFAAKYFLDQPSVSVDRSKLPPTARDVSVAKVRIVGGPDYRLGRHESVPLSDPKDALFVVSAKIVRVLDGRLTIGDEHSLYFGTPGLGRRMMYPHTPRQKSAEYFMASYLDEGRLRRLVAFPVSEPEYDAWEQEVFAYEQERWRSGR
jgi:hypothetical protein